MTLLVTLSSHIGDFITTKQLNKDFTFTGRILYKQKNNTSVQIELEIEWIITEWYGFLNLKRRQVKKTTFANVDRFTITTVEIINCIKQERIYK